MLEGKSTDDLRAIAIAGGGLEINGAAYSTDDLRAIAIAGNSKECQLIIHNSKSKSTDDLRAIATAGKGRVIFT